MLKRLIVIQIIIHVLSIKFPDANDSIYNEPKSTKKLLKGDRSRGKMIHYRLTDVNQYRPSAKVTACQTLAAKNNICTKC